MTHRIAEDNASPDKTDAGQNPLDHAADRIRIRGRQTSSRRSADHCRNSCSQTNQRMRAKPGRFSVKLAIQAKDGTDDKSGSKPQSCLFSSTQHSTMLC